MSGNILVAEDQDTARVSLCELLREEGYQVHEAADGAAAVRLIDQLDLDLVLTDLRIPGPDGLQVLKHIREVSPQTLGILMTAYASVDTAVEALHLGAQDYIIKPLIFADVLGKVRRLMEHRSLAWEIQMLRREAYKHSAPDRPVGRSQAIQGILALVEKVAATPSTVLITGESGSGKEVIARSIHLQSERKGNVFLPVNCSAIPETLLESQLFGYIKGAFTGATASQEGLFQRARGGTIFLDEIGEMPLSLQPKLLRVIEEKKVLSVGSTNPIQVDVRIIASTNRDLKTEVEEGRFRGDLFYRLNVIGIHIPPLRERREDIPLLVEYLVRRHNLEMKKSYKGVDNPTMRLLISLPWKGNVRELDNVLERAMILGSGEWIVPADLPAGDVPQSDLSSDGTLDAVLRGCERVQIERSLEEAGGDKRRASEHLGLSLSTLYRKMERLGIDTK
ncbi:MAG: sigma-54-dependent transcriptional regulator [Candidatus Binatia bacterium]